MIRGTGLRDAGEADAPDRRAQRRHAHAPAPGLAGRAAGAACSGPSTATRPSAAGRSTASPSRCGRWAAVSRPPRAAIRRSRSTAARCTASTTTCPWPRPRSSRACCSPALVANGETTIDEPHPTRDHTERLLLRAGVAGATRGLARDRALDRRARARRGHRARRPVLGRVPHRRRPARAGIAPDRRGRGRQLDAARLPARARADGRRSSSATSSPRARRRRPEEPVADLDIASGPLEGTTVEPTKCRWPSTSCRWSRSSAASPRARPWCAAPTSCASRSPTASPAWSTGCAAWAPTSRPPTTASSCAAPAACAAARSRPAATTGWPCSAPSPAWPREEGVEVVGMDAAAVSYPGFPDDLAAAGLRWWSRSTAPPGPGSRRSRARWPRRSASRIWTPARCTAASPSPGPRSIRPRWTSPSTATACCSTAATSPRPSAPPRSPRAPRA